MQERYIAPAIMLAAGAITSVFNIINQVEFFDGTKKLFVILILFYIIGRIAALIIRKVTKVRKVDINNIPAQNQDFTDMTRNDET